MKIESWEAPLTRVLSFFCFACLLHAYQTDKEIIIWPFENKICRMNGLTGKKMQKIFEALVPESVYNNARNLVEYCCFRFLSRDGSDIHPSLQVLKTLFFGWFVRNHVWCSFSVLFYLSSSWSHQTCMWYFFCFLFERLIYWTQFSKEKKILFLIS